MSDFLQILRESLPEAIGGLVVAAILAIFGKIWHSKRKKFLNKNEYQIQRKSFSITNLIGTHQTNKVNSVFTVRFSADIEIRNDTQHPKDLKIVLENIDSGWSLAKNISEIAYEIRSNSHSAHQLATARNSITLEALKITAIHIKASIPFMSSTDTQGVNYIEHPRRIVVNLRFETVGKKPTLKSIECDLSEIHKGVEQDVVTCIRSHQTQNVEQGLQYLQIFKRYWGIES